MEGYAVLIERGTGRATAVEMDRWRIAAAFEGAERHYEHVASTATKSAALARVARLNARKPRKVSFASAMTASAFTSARR